MTEQGLLDKIITIATKANAAINVVAPGSGTVGTVAIELTKFIVEKVNARRARAGEEPIALPADDVLIQRLRKTSERVVTAGEVFLNQADDAEGSRKG